MYQTIFVFFICLLSHTKTMRGNEVILVHKDGNILTKDLFDQYFNSSAEEEEIPDEETIILSVKNKRPIPILASPKISVNEEVKLNDVKKPTDYKCELYKRGSDLNLEKMADVWQVAYYKLPHDISCFKIHIKLNTYEEKKRNYDLYGHLSSKIDWNLCNLEIKSSDVNVASYRKHFLHGTVNQKGVMENVIIEEVKDYNGDSKALLFEEAPDQWLVVKNLLLMRDCWTGGIVVFARSPYKPRREDIFDALMIFGEDQFDGNMNCLGLPFIAELLMS